MEKLEHDIDSYQQKINLAESSTTKYNISGFLLLFATPFFALFIATLNLSDNQAIFSLMGFMGLAAFIVVAGLSNSEQQKFQAENEKNKFLDELKSTLIKEDFIKAYENTIARLKEQDQSEHLNRIMFEKSKEYFDKFIVDISKQDKKDWDYYYCLYKHYYFYKHLKDHASFKQLDEKKFEPVCYNFY